MGVPFLQVFISQLLSLEGSCSPVANQHVASRAELMELIKVAFLVEVQIDKNLASPPHRRGW